MQSERGKLLNPGIGGFWVWEPKGLEHLRPIEPSNQEIEVEKTQFPLCSAYPFFEREKTFWVFSFSPACLKATWSGMITGYCHDVVGFLDRNLCCTGPERGRDLPATLGVQGATSRRTSGSRSP